MAYRFAGVMAENLIEDYNESILTPADIDDIIGGLQYMMDELKNARGK